MGVCCSDACGDDDDNDVNALPPSLCSDHQAAVTFLQLRDWRGGHDGCSCQPRPCCCHHRCVCSRAASFSRQISLVQRRFTVISSTTRRAFTSAIGTCSLAVMCDEEVHPCCWEADVQLLTSRFSIAAPALVHRLCTGTLARWKATTPSNFSVSFITPCLAPSHSALCNFKFKTPNP